MSFYTSLTGLKADLAAGGLTLGGGLLILAATLLTRPPRPEW